jgi:hypothetical protein
VTLEEAAEIVLDGKAWVPCTVCFGVGSVRKAMVEIGDPIYLDSKGASYSLQTCSCCNGSGGAVCLAYKKACELLGKKPNVIVWVPIQNPIGRVVGVNRGTCDVELRDKAFLPSGPATRGIYRLKMDHDT